MKLSKYERLHQRYISRMAALKDNKEISDIADELESGRTHVLKMKRLETSSFDDSWIKQIEDCIYDLGTIIKAPKLTTKTVGEIVKVELARKIGSESVIHLASHTNYVKEVDENGNVIPSKILNIGSEDNYATYENRFIATLIRRLMLFVQKRYEYVASFAKISNADVLYIKNKSIVDGMEVEIETKIRVTQPIETSQEQLTNYLNRILLVRKYVSFYYYSDFMKKLKTEHDVRNPIMQTNIIRKNPAYNKCYRLYRFLESYDSIGVNHKVSEEYENFSGKDLEDVNTTILANFLAIKGQESSSTIKKTYKESKPKVLTSMDDEIFEFGPLQKGPLHFVRMDDEYLLNMTARHRLPEHMNKYEKIYWEDELDENRELADDLTALKKLIQRKKAELRFWEKQAQSLVNKRKAEEEIARRKAELARLKEEEERLKEARRKLVESALANEEVFPKEEPIVEETLEPVIEQPEVKEPDTLEIIESADANPDTTSIEEVASEPVVAEPVAEENKAVEEESASNEESSEPVIDEAPVEEVISEPAVEEATSEDAAPEVNNSEENAISEDIPEETPVEETASEPTNDVDNVPTEPTTPVEEVAEEESAPEVSTEPVDEVTPLDENIEEFAEVQESPNDNNNPDIIIEDDQNADETVDIIGNVGEENAEAPSVEAPAEDTSVEEAPIISEPVSEEAVPEVNNSEENAISEEIPEETPIEETISESTNDVDNVPTEPTTPVEEVTAEENAPEVSTEPVDEVTPLDENIEEFAEVQESPNDNNNPDIIIEDDQNADETVDIIGNVGEENAEAPSVEAPAEDTSVEEAPIISEPVSEEAAPEANNSEENAISEDIIEETPVEEIASEPVEEPIIVENSPEEVPDVIVEAPEENKEPIKVVKAPKKRKATKKKSPKADVKTVPVEEAPIVSEPVSEEAAPVEETKAENSSVEKAPVARKSPKTKKPTTKKKAPAKKKAKTEPKPVEEPVAVPVEPTPAPVEEPKPIEVPTVEPVVEKKKVVRKKAAATKPAAKKKASSSNSKKRSTTTKRKPKTVVEAPVKTGPISLEAQRKKLMMSKRWKSVSKKMKKKRRK